MKRILKKVTCVILTALIICTITPLAASAAGTIDYPKTQTFYMAGKNKGVLDETIFINNVPVKSTILKSSVKVTSGKSVVSLTDVSRFKNSSYNEYFENGLKPYSYTSNSFFISFDIKKAGTSRISFKIGNKSCVSTVKVLPYVNPIARLTLTGVKNGSDNNLAGKFKTNNSGSYVRLNKAQKNAVLTCNAASGWKITSMRFINKKTNITRNVASINGLKASTGVSYMKLNTGNLVAKQTGEIIVYLRNAKTGASQTCTLNLK